MTNSTSAPVDASAFDLTPEPELANGSAALCLHGLTGTPYEMRPIAEALVARGIRARGPVGAGHEEGPQLLAATPRGAWLDAARSEFEALRRDSERVFLVGVSMGGLLCLRLAQSARVDALVVIGTPLVLPPPTPQLLPLLRRVMRFRKKHAPDIQDPVARARHPGHRLTPLDAVAELIALQGDVIPELAAISAPILVAHGEKDRTARPADAQRIHAEVGSRDKELFMLERSGHVVTVDYDGPALARAAADFLGRR
ncbi:MAG: alpha/beta fold hydrolase [Deltaproteobacteria bacterium]|nr:alpha/beta fold hydrolase [Deltaproteobacteria bacterium]